MGFPLKKSRTRAPGLSSAHGTIWGAQGSRVRLTDGLARTKKTPTSVPTAPQPIPDSHPFHILRVENSGGGLTGSLALTKGPAGPRGLDGAWFLSGDYLSGLGSPGVKLDKVAIGNDGDIDLRGFFCVDARIRAGFNAVRIHVSLSGPDHASRYEELTRGG